VELAQDVEAREDGWASDRLTTYPFGGEALGGFAEVPTELLGQGRSEGRCAVR
jgi:hypothetical protein